MGQQGKPLTVVEVVNGQITARTENLDHIFNQIPDKDMEVAIISIAGELRIGKSFTMNFFRQYLEYRANHGRTTRRLRDDMSVHEDLETHPWLRDLDRKGFSFRSGIVRETVGISMWSKPFIMKKLSGKRIAVVLMDSQGLYDPSTSADDNVRIFTMVSLLSSSIILYTRGNIDTSKLSQLDYFMEYAKLGSKIDSKSKPFQRLTFLLRDFNLVNAHGWEGGKQALDHYLNAHEEQSEDTVKVAESLKLGFELIDCFALPSAGEVITDPKFDGTLTSISPKFLKHFEEFVINITEKAGVKKIISTPLLASEYASYVTKLANEYNQRPSAQELVSMHERELIMKIVNNINERVMQYADNLMNWIQTVDCEYLTSRDVFTVKKDIVNMHEHFLETAVNDFKGNPMSSIIMAYDEDGNDLTAIRFLSLKIKQRFFNQEQEIINTIAMSRKAFHDNDMTKDDPFVNIVLKVATAVGTTVALKYLIPLLF